jgi:hypothetical protein
MDKAGEPWTAHHLKLAASEDKKAIMESLYGSLMNFGRDGSGGLDAQKIGRWLKANEGVR